MGRAKNLKFLNRRNQSLSARRCQTLGLAAAATATLPTAVDSELILVSSVDGGSVTVTVAAATQSSTLDPDGGMIEFSEPVSLPATSASICKAVEWMQHEWRRNQEPLSEKRRRHSLQIL